MPEIALDSWTVPLAAGASITALAYRAAASRLRPVTLVLAHGAGADQRSPFMVQAAQALATSGVTTITFNFPYKEQRRSLPDKTPVLETCYRDVVHFVACQPATTGSALFIGGKSMGGRIATQIVAGDAALPVAGVVALGYPLHPPGKPQQRRDAHLPALRRPLLIVQGSRDTFGAPGEFSEVLTQMRPPPLLHVIDGGDHSFKVPRSTGRTAQDVLTHVIETITRWIQEQLETEN